MSRRLNSVNILQLSPLHQRVVCLLLRQPLASHNDVCFGLPDVELVMVEAALRELVEQGWVQRETVDDSTRYTAQLEDDRAVSETLEGLCPPAVNRRGGRRVLPDQIWNKLDDSLPNEVNLRRRPSPSAALLDTLTEDEPRSILDE